MTSTAEPTTARDTALFDLIAQEAERQRLGLELIASENFTSAAVREAQGSIVTNKYAEGYPGKRWYGGCEVVDRIEQLAIDRVRELFGAAWANVQPHSGSSANLAVYNALIEPGSVVLGMDLSHGGHLTHGNPVNFSGLRYQIVSYKVNPDTELIDMDEVRRLAHEHQPKMIIAGASAYSRTIDFAAFREIADEVGAILFADIAHIAGLIAAGVHPNALPHAHVVASTTHKTLRGPRGGIILSNDPELGAKIDRAVFPGYQGGPLEHVIAAKAVAFGECLTDEFKAYAAQIIRNAQALAQAFEDKGYRVVSGGTDNHLFVLDLRPQGLNGTKATRLLDANHITISKSTLPYDTEKILHGGGIRIGTPAVTTRGMTEADMQTVADLIDRALKGQDVKAEVHAFAGGFPIP
ncbi:serine hydroxymethyltransferase [Deinococcus soli (ex Cha et al. 2016)]|uniref:Serine hydroxymethyltransferase n=2 Tax=Deinococcus soli (ex Cha et al. 2016) TaxID=1309411 RepID=A0A0F7JKQ6_9DEIO|nr:serine hydroxymethyltransferase [Deinococcus soli (ex Cha et al. 2016)]AKH16831.1 serine hydroxymethyltransferase [Deinococcus soli (ex Cha et al. 2016)]MDR6220623.1 glycine hydroxymethyltransferase [Deinococcus soli (ex Cha et al. 2016)]MDR6330478.1 glycine hydroxymethyltransferase [Deinococcus soli (ex Cha et al. 2016)]MDR6753629.1 glycine hydroxymethyltransferase [Deinococcus soli (ex Cha et al. 2016)]